MKFIRILLIVIIVSLIGLIFFLAIQTNPPSWTGFGESEKDDAKEAAKTLWDWLDLMIIPIALALIGWLWGQIEKAKTMKSEDERSKNETLESFLKVMTELIITNNLHNGPTPQTIAISRARINIALSNLDGERKGQVLQFLYEANLIEKNPPKLSLVGSNLKNILIDEIKLGESEIRGAYFNNSSIQNANLNGVHMIACDFTGANLSKTLVKNADFSYSIFLKAKLRHMDLTTANFEGCDLSNADLRGSTILKQQLDNILNKNNVIVVYKEI